MSKSGQKLVWMIGLPITLVLATSGCATKNFVRQQVAPVSQRVSDLETQTAALGAKQEADVSALNERISTTDMRVAQVSDIANQAQGTASRAMTLADENRAAIAAGNTKLSTLAAEGRAALNFQVVDQGNVTFAFGKADLTPEAISSLDTLVAKYNAQPRGVIELTGFTDRVGSKNYNLELSRRRAQAVQRYLIRRGVPLHNIYIAGMGKSGAMSDAEMATMRMSKRHGYDRAARRVHIRVLGAGALGGTQGTAGRSE